MSQPGAFGRLALAVALALIALPVIAAALPSVEIPAPTESPFAPAGSSPSLGAGGIPRGTMGDDRGGNHSFQLSELRPVSVDGVDYYAFALDPEETNRAHSRDASLDVLRLYIAERGDIRSIEALTLEGDLLLDLLAGGGVGWIAGRRSSDREGRGNRAEYLVPTGAFRGIDPDRYLYLHSRFAATSGGTSHGSGSAEAGDRHGRSHEHCDHPPVAEPATLLLVAPGLLAAVLARRHAQLLG
jgi:hypothetical protein